MNNQHCYRVTLVIGSLGSGGAERAIVALAEGLVKCGHEVTIVTLDPNTPDFYSVPAEVSRIHAPELICSDCRWFDVSAWRQRFKLLRNTIIEAQPDLVISFIDTVNVLVLQALFFASIPVIVSERIDWRFHPIGIRWRFLRRVFYLRAASVVVQTQSVASVAKKYWPKWSIAVIPNAVADLNVSPQPRPKWFATYNLIAMGRLVYQKGFDLLLEAFAKVHQKFPEWHLTILGEGPLRKSLEEQVLSLGLTDKVTMIGVMNAPFSILRQADLFVLSSRYEGFPNALSEAMACELPVISFDCPSGPAEIVRNNIDGILVPPEDVVALAKALKVLMADEYLRDQYATRSVEVLDRFSSERIYDMWDRLIQQVINKE